MNNPKQWQLCRHIKDRELYRLIDKSIKCDNFKPLTRPEIVKLWERAEDDGSELPEQVSEKMTEKIFNCLNIGKTFAKVNIPRLKQAGLIKQTPKQGMDLADGKDSTKIQAIKNQSSVKVGQR